VLAVAFYGLFMFAGRMLNGPIVRRLGPRSTVLLQGAAIFAGGVLIVSGLPGWVAITGCALTGLGLAGVIPLALSVAGLEAPGEAGAASGAIMVVGYIGLASAPFVAGIVAETVSTRAVMTMEALCGLVIVALGVRIASRTMVRANPN
jgi:MFS family permease